MKIQFRSLVRSVWRALQRHPGRWIVLANLTAVAGLVGVAGFMLWQLRLDAGRQHEIAAQSLVQVLSRDLSRNIEIYDLSLQAVVDNIGKPGLGELSSEFQRLVLFDHSAAAPGFGFMLVTDAKGTVTQLSRQTLPPGLNRADAESFRYFVAHPEDTGLHISPPKISRLSGQWMVMLSRRISNPDGSFAGIVMGGLYLDYVRGLFASVGAEHAGTVVLYGVGGAIMMREPFDPNVLGASMAAAPSYQRMVAMRDGSFTGPAMFGPGERKFTFARVGDGPLILGIAVEPQVIYAGWQRQALCLGMILLGLCGVTVALTWLLRLELTRRHRIEMRLAAANTKLVALAATDALTGLSNRRCFDEALAQEWGRAVRVPRPLSLILLDADMFKGFNDTYGHQQGDKALRLIADTIRSVLDRASDLAFRIGGEEFAVVLPETDADGAGVVAERIRAAVAGRVVPHATSSNGVLTVSCGVASVPHSFAVDMMELIAAADTALYAAKDAGRNIVRSAERIEPTYGLVA